MAFLGSGPENDTSVYRIDEGRACWLPRDRAVSGFTLEIPKKVETYEVVETIKHEETNPCSLVAFTERNVIITQSALVGERGSSLRWKAGPWHCGGSLATGGSHTICCHRACRRAKALSSMPGPVRYFLSAQTCCYLW